MKHISFLLSAAAMLALSSCSQNTRTTDAKGTTDTVTTEVSATEEKGLFADMSIKDTVKVGELVTLKFTVHNNADSVQQFCKWHTPFEPWISKYLDIKDETGEEVAYKGAMAKRIMPPPADSYLKVNSKDSLSVEVDLLKGYNITKPAKYTVVYNSQSMSGLIVKDSISFVYSK